MQLFGIDISFHWSWWIIAGIFILPNVFALNLTATIISAMIVLFLCGLILMHELAHALTARHYGYKTQYIMMHLAGGVAMVQMSNASPKENFWIAAAGPASNIVLGIVSIVPMLLFADVNILSQVLESFVAINLAIGLFNLIPAYPMDGGRMLRAVLYKDKAMATQVSHALSVLFGSTFMMIGLAMYDPILFIVGMVLMYFVIIERKSGNSGW